METLWTFKTENFRIVLGCEPERDPDVSWADAETLDKLESGEWVNVTFAVKVYSANGQELSAAYLGNSIYADPRDFRREHIGAQGKWGAYFRDMLSEAVAEARGELAFLRQIPLHRAA